MTDAAFLLFDLGIGNRLPVLLEQLAVGDRRRGTGCDVVQHDVTGAQPSERIGMDFGTPFLVGVAMLLPVCARHVLAHGVEEGLFTRKRRLCLDRRRGERQEEDDRDKPDHLPRFRQLAKQ